MNVVHTKSQLRAMIRSLRGGQRRIGFVPTMGYLHQGHVSLIRQARQENDAVVVSVFVNPTQFGPNEDLEAYPRDRERDLALLHAEKCDIGFFPNPEELYPSGFMTYVRVEGPMTQVLCGRSRPTHFQGVATIVTKLFHLVQPDRAYFGQKDAQQVAVIRQMARDLDFDLDIVACPTVREADGLAMSSRNSYLSPAQRRMAPMIYQSLLETRQKIIQGERSATKMTTFLKSHLDLIDSADIDYVSIMDSRTLMPLETLSGEILIAVAVRIGQTRLIDNIQFEV
jgi:pantoate--beta-alanine ligase